MKKTAAFRFLSATLAVLLAINTAAAGRWLRSCWTGPAACCDTCCPEPVCEVPNCCPSPTACDTCGVVETVTSDCGCGGEVVETAPATVYESPTPELAAPPEEEMAPVAPFGGGFRSDTPAPAPVPNEPPSDDWNTGVEEPVEVGDAVAVPTPAEEPAEDLFSEPAAPADEPMDAGPMEAGPMDAEPAMAEEPVAEPADDLFGEEPMMEEPAVEEPADDLFGEPMEEETAPVEEPPADDLFGEEPADDLFGEEPMADEPAVEEPADDLFGEPMEEESAPVEEPADDLFGAPAEEPAEDMFDEEAAPADDLFGEPMEEEPAPVEEPADDLFGAPAEEPAEDMFDEEAAPADDLFGEPMSEEPAAEEAPADDLFGEEPAEDLFGAPAEEPAEMPADSGDEGLFDDFGGEESDSLFDEAPADEADPADGDVEDDLFGGFGAILREPGGVDSARDRTWVDNTGRFSTIGRLIAIDGDAVRLAKQGGGVATVPLSRLSQSDLEFVSRQSIAQHQAREWAIARGERDAEQPKQAQAKDGENLMRTAQL